MELDRSAQTRLAVLERAPLDRWVALSSDETRIIASGETFDEVADAIERLDEKDSVMIRVPPDWIPRVL